MLNVLASEIEDIINLTGDISLPQIVVTIANVILLAANIILAIVKKIKNAKNNKQIQKGETSSEPVALNEEKELNEKMEHFVKFKAVMNKEKKMENLVKFKAVISKEKFENGHETVSVAEGTDLGSVLHNAVSDIPEEESAAPTIKAVLSSTYIDAIAHCYENTGNNKVLTGIDAVLAAFNCKLSITTEREEEVITVVKKEETLL